MLHSVPGFSFHPHNPKRAAALYPAFQGLGSREEQKQYGGRAKA